MPASSSDSLTSRFARTVLGIEKREFVPVAWSFAYFFCVLSSYYMLRPMREAMGVESGVETIPVLFTTTFFVMLFATSAFGWVASRYPRRTFLPWVYYFFAANVLIFYGVFSYAVNNDVPIVWIGRCFFVWISIFNLFVVSVFWSFMADIYSRAQGRRLFGVISAGGSLGALIGPFATAGLVEPLGFQNLLPISAGLLLVAVFCIYNLRRWVAHEHAKDEGNSAASRKPLGGSALGGFRHVARSRYLTAISVSSVLASLLGTALYMFVNQLVGEAIQGTDSRTQLFGILDGASNTMTFLFQLLAVKTAVRRFGVGVTLALMPAISIAGFALVALSPVLLLLAVFQSTRRAVGFGFMKPSTDMLYSVVTPKEKYKGKNFVDTAVYRAGDLIGSWVIRAALPLGMSTVFWLLVPFAIAWTAISLWLGREYKRRDESGQIGEASNEQEIESPRPA